MKTIMAVLLLIMSPSLLADSPIAVLIQGTAETGFRQVVLYPEIKLLLFLNPARWH